MVAVLLTCVLFIGLPVSGAAQSLPYTKLYDDTKVSSIYILMPEDSVTELYANLENELYYHATFIFDDGLTTDTVENIGFRLRGNTSLYSAKKSFKVSFNAFSDGGKYEGVEKLNLLGMHNDPTMVREKLYFDTYNAFGLPGRRSNFVRVYVNETYAGVYTNIEHVDENYIQSRYGNNEGNLFKCTWPADLQWRGNNPSDYLDDGYEWTINEDNPYGNIQDLIHLIDVINNTSDSEFPCALEAVFDVQQFLKTYALDIAAGHWDNYAGNINNFYLYYNMASGRYEFLSYDADNSFGVDWLGFDWTEKNIYDWPTGWYYVPLVERLLAVDSYRADFTYYLQQLQEGPLHTDSVAGKVLAWRDLIAEAALEDVFRTFDYGYTYDDFWNGFTDNDIDCHTPYGIIPFVAARNNQTTLQAGPATSSPLLSELLTWPVTPIGGAPLSVLVHVESVAALDAVEAQLVWDGGASSTLTLFDDGLHEDFAAGDGWYGNTLEVPELYSTLSLSITATDMTAATSTYPVCGPLQFANTFTPPAVVINELMPLNLVTIADEAGQYEDYIELYNAGGTTQSLYGYYLSDDTEEPWKWRLPNTVLQPDSYLLIWADNSPEDGTYHADFSLNVDGETVGLYAPAASGYAPVDVVSYPTLASDQSWGRLPNGIGEQQLLPTPSPGANNESSDTLPENTLPERPYLTNNPSSTYSDLFFDAIGSTRYEVILSDMNGRHMATLYAGTPSEGTVKVHIPTRTLAAGMYVVRLVTPTAAQSFQLVRL